MLRLWTSAVLLTMAIGCGAMALTMQADADWQASASHALAK